MANGPYDPCPCGSSKKTKFCCGTGRRAASVPPTSSSLFGGTPGGIVPAANIPFMIKQAVQYHQAGRLSQAETLYMEVLHFDPHNTDALHLRGVLAHQTGRSDIAVDYISKAIARNRRVADFHNNLGLALQALGRFGEAVASYREALKLRPDFAEARNNLGNTLRDQGRMDEAVTCYREALRLKPGYPEAHYNLGTALQAQGALDEAVASYREALGLNPAYAKALNNLGAALQMQGKPDEAVACYREALRLNPGHADAHYNLGAALQVQGRLDEALASYREALRLKPALPDACYHMGVLFHAHGYPEEAVASYREALRLNPGHAKAHNNLGAVLQIRDNLDEAEAQYREALRLEPGFAEAHKNLGGLLQSQGRLSEAIACFRQAVELKPDYHEARNNLATALDFCGRREEAIEAYRELMRLKPDYASAHSNYLMCIHYSPAYSREALFQEALAWGERHAPPELRMSPPANDPDPERRLRIGYVSADFRTHPVGYFIEAVLGAHDKSQVEVFCYANQRQNDEVTERLRQFADHWEDISALSDDEAANLVRRDGIDILIDLSGHTGHNRLQLFARKPAPVQATWMGYYATTGVRAMDYIIADRFVLPPEEERFFVEKPVRLPDSYLCFTPPRLNIEVSSLPALAVGYVTFGCFNSIVKITPEVVRLWAGILRAVPNSRLFLKAMALGASSVCDRYQQMFAEHGIHPDRLTFSGGAPRAEMLAAYNQVDIGLDPFPFTGGTTTVEALWMGVPVVSLKGDRFAGHVSESILATAAGLAEWVAESEEAYVAKAVGWAADLARLAELRKTLRQRLVNSPLCDGNGFTRGLEAAYREMWRGWCGRVK